MALVPTKTPVFDDIPSIEFFNGRLLSGEDLATEQAWNTERRKLLGKALGSGVAYGLEVSLPSEPEYVGKPVVKVAAGLAINRDGDTLFLETDTHVSLVQETETETSIATGFSTCTPTQFGVYLKANGVYLLAVCPATGKQGRAPVSGLGNQEARCNAKYRREGVQFRLHQLKLEPQELADPDKLRNLVAYKCFKPNVWQSFVSKPYSTPDAKPVLLDGLLTPALEDSEVPLGTIYWTVEDGVEYVDLWSVRRRPVLLPDNTIWLDCLEPAVVIESEARLQQLQAHLAELAKQATTPAVVKATTYLRFLPPAGAVPISGGGSQYGFNAYAFFGNQVRETPQTVSLADAVGLMARSGSQLPVELQNVSRLYLYWVKENLDAVSAGEADVRYLIYSVEPAYPIDESVRKCLLDAADAYSGLLAKGRFVPADGLVPLRNVLQLTGLIHFVVQGALGGIGILYRARDDQLTALFNQLYHSQLNFATSLSASALSNGNVDNSTLFASLVLAQLNVDQGVAAPSLRSAVQQQNIVAAVNAQNRITDIVLRESGEILIGNLEATYIGSVRGETLAINDVQPFVFLFRVTNKTNHALPSIQLETNFLPPKENWSSFATVVDPETGIALPAISLAAFDPLNPNDTGATRIVGVAVNTPLGTTSGDKGTLWFSAFVPPPVNVRANATRELSIGAAVTPPAPGTVSFTADSPGINGDLGNAEEGVSIMLTFEFVFSALTGPAQRDFRFHLEATAPADPWTWFAVSFEPAKYAIDEGSSGTTTKASTRFSMGDGKPALVRMRLTPKAGSKGRSLNFNTSVESVTDSIKAAINGMSMIVK